MIRTACLTLLAFVFPALAGCASLASFINLPASQFQISTIQFCAGAPAVLAKHPGNAPLAAAVQSLCATPPGITPTPTQTAALSTALQQITGG